MKLVRGLLAVAVLGLLAGVAYVSQLAEPAAAKMVRAAEKLVASLTAEQKAKASYDFDDKERTNWYFTPQQKGRKPTRKGLPLEEMTAEQQETTRDLLVRGHQWLRRQAGADDHEPGVGPPRPGKERGDGPQPADGISSPSSASRTRRGNGAGGSRDITCR